jgi:DNA-binding MarR family transcriptional regulator
MIGSVKRREWWAEGAILQEVYSTGALMTVLVNRELEAAGVTPQYFSFLGWIALLEPVTPGALAAETGIPATTIRDYVRALVERGDVRKAKNPADGRSYLLELTAQGRRLTERGRPSLERAYAKLEPHLVRPPRDYIDRAVELRAALREALAES